MGVVSQQNSLDVFITKRGILLTDIAQTSNMLLDAINVEICWRTLQISGSLSKDTVPIILYIFQFWRERMWGKCLNCPRLQPLAPVPAVRHDRTPSPAAAYPRPCPRPWPRPHPPQEEKTGRRRSHAVPAGEGGPRSPTDEDRVELFRAPTLAAARQKASARLMPSERAPPHPPTPAPPDL